MARTAIRTLAGGLVVGGLLLTGLQQAEAAPPTWTPLESAGDNTLPIAQDHGRTLLISTGGPDDATIYEQHRAADGSLGPRTAITTVDEAEGCLPARSATAIGNVAVAVECRTTTGLEDPPIRLAALVHTDDDGWTWQIFGDARLGSLDYSPGGQYVVFTTNSEYGRRHHVTTYHADLGWQDLRRRERGFSGDRVIAAVTDAGAIIELQSAGSEDEPGYWIDGRLALSRFDPVTARWTRLQTHRYPDGGIFGTDIDVAGGRVFATATRYRDTGQLNGRDARLLVLRGGVPHAHIEMVGEFTRGILAAHSAITRDGVGVAAWQAKGDDRLAAAAFLTWSPRRSNPTVVDLQATTKVTNAVGFGRGLDLALQANGHGVIAWVESSRKASRSTVGAASFAIARHGRIVESGPRRPVDATWRDRPLNTTVSVSSSVRGGTVTLGRLDLFLPSRQVRFSSLQTGSPAALTRPGPTQR